MFYFHPLELILLHFKCNIQQQTTGIPVDRKATCNRRQQLGFRAGEKITDKQQDS